MSFFAPTVQGAEYFQEIEATFVARRQRNVFLSPHDWALMNAWYERDIPLFIVIRAINDVFDLRDKQQYADKRAVKSLSYCKEEIEAQFAEWSAARVGSSGELKTESGKCEDGFTVGRVLGHIDASIEQLQLVERPELKLAIDTAVEKLTHYRGILAGHEGADGLEPDWEIVDADLNAVDRDLEAALQINAAAEEVRTIEASIKRDLAAYDNIDEASYQRTFTMMLLKQLRDRSGIPRLGLFYL